MEERKSRSWLKPTVSIIGAIIMAVTGANYAFNPTLTLNFDSLFGSGRNQTPPTVINEPREAPGTGSTSGVASVGDVADNTIQNPAPSESGVGGTNQSPPISSIDSDPDELIEPSNPEPNQSVGNDPIPAPVSAGSVDIALITRDPNDGGLLTDVCYVLVDYSQQGCDENSDGQVTFADIPYGTYTVRQTVTPAGYPAIDDYEIDVEPATYIDGSAADVPLGFVAKQAPEQNPPDTRNVSVVTVDYMTNERVATDVCVEIVGTDKQECDNDLEDGQVDFLDVPAGGPYELRFDLPPGYELEIEGGSLAIKVDADDNQPANEIVFIRIKVPDETGIADDPVAAPQETATLDVTLRACPDHVMPQNVNPATDCTITIDGSDPAGVYWEGDHPGSVLLTQTERLGDGTYRTTVPANVALSLRHLEPNLRDDYMAVGAHSMDHTGVPVITLNPAETANITLYYYYYVTESVVTQPPDQVVAPDSTGTTIRLTFRACQDDGFNANTNDFHTHCTTPLDTPGAAEISWGEADWESIKITTLHREWDGAYIFEVDSHITSVEISGLEPSLRDGFTVLESNDVIESDDRGEDADGEETFTLEFGDDDDATRDVFIYYYYD